MKLYYYQENNFGDQLNPWLWKQILPNEINDDIKIGFLGIGTLLNQTYITKLNRSQYKIIFSSGFGYSKGDVNLDNSYKIYCVRGPLTAQKLGLSETLAITDGALLVKDFFNYNQYQKKYKFGYIPHYELAGEGWAAACEKIGFNYIDPRWSVEKVLSSISETEILLAEAMHGAIIADTFRVPWIPIITNSTILQFKWQDWSASLKVNYTPAYIKRLQHPSKKLDFLTPVRSIRNQIRQNEAAKELLKISQSYQPTLSQDKIIDECSHKLYEKLDNLKHDLTNGVFHD